MEDFTIVAACTPDYLKHLQWVLPTWSYKPQFANKPIIIFTNGFSDVKNYPEFEFVKKYFSNWTFIDWHFPKASSKREEIFSAFIFGTEFIKTPFFVKLDANVYFINKKDTFDDDDFNHDLVSHRWGYTRPGWWLKALDNAYNNTDIPFEKIPDEKVCHHRIKSHICLHRTEFVKNLAAKLPGGKLPVPSHDTTIWYYTDKEGKWKTKNFGKFGVVDNTRWRSIREGVCSNGCRNNSFLNEILLSHVQLEITSKCQLKCYNCDRNCGIAPTEEYMYLEQIWKFVDESLTLEHKWDRIDIIGGEPTLYPELTQMFKFIKMYKDRYPKCKIRFSTNGLDPAPEILKQVPSWVEIRNSLKECKVQKFEAINSAPMDHGERHIKSCSIPWRCGLGLNKYGYHFCGPGASIARVFGLNIGIKYLVEVDSDSILEQANQLCKFCGHSNVDSKHMTKEPDISPIWQDAIRRYNNEKPKLELY